MDGKTAVSDGPAPGGKTIPDAGILFSGFLFLIFASNSFSIDGIGSQP